jgi:hypothetical protein
MAYHEARHSPVAAPGFFMLNVNDHVQMFKSEISGWRGGHDANDENNGSE